MSGLATSIVSFLLRNRSMASNSNNDNSYKPTVQDVLSVKESFLKLIPAELIDQIIDFAEYWPHNTVLFSRDFRVHNNGETIFLHSQPLPGAFVPEGQTEGVEISAGGCVRTLAPARKVVFRIWSHDQGWSDNPGKGTYHGSFTWFEAFLERPLSVAAVMEATPIDEPISIDDRVLSARQSELGWKTVAIPDGDTGKTSKRRHIQSNVHANDTHKKHTVVWSWDDRPGSHVENGAGRGGDFVRSMRPGDRVSIVARAKYPAWMNYVRRAEIVVYYAI